VSRKIIVIIVLALLFQLLLSLHAGSSREKELFISKCGQCHKTGGEGPLFSANKYASRQWKRFFARNKHKRKKDISGLISADDQETIKNYLMKHAADSSQPEAAGLK